MPEQTDSTLAGHPGTTGHATQPTVAIGHSETMLAEPGGQTYLARSETLAAGPGATVLKDLPPSAFAAPRTTVVPTLSKGERGPALARNEGERYEAKGLLGRGGMGEVMLAYDRDIGRPVAVKRLLQESPHMLARFADEIRTLGKLEHPNITPIHDVDVDESGRLFFTMRYVDGESLADVINRLKAGDEETRERYTLSRRLDVFAGIIRALQYSHGLGLLHRDIKPENVMIGPGGEVVLTDWGIAKPIGSAETHTHQESEDTPVTEREARASATVAGSVVGTPLYMSPEQAKGRVHDLDERSDLYSAFLVLFEMLTLRTMPESKDDPMRIVQQMTMIEPPQPWTKAWVPESEPPVGSEWRHFIVQGLQNDREKRHRDAAEVLHRLDLIRSGKCVVQCPVTFVKAAQNGMGRAIEKRPVTLLGTMALGILLTLSAIAFSVYTLAAG